MAIIDTDFTPEQLETIEQLREVLKAGKTQRLHIAGLHDYEVQIQRDAGGKPYLSLT